MEKSEDKSLVPRSPDGGVAIGGKGQRLIKRMNEDALATIEAPRQDLAPVMRRLGDYELRKEDYEQLHIWSQDFTEDGLPITALEIIHELASLAVAREWLVKGKIISARFLFLKEVNNIKTLNFSKVTELKWLDCVKNQITHLEISKVPELRELRCQYNHLNELDSSNVPKLKSLFCSDNFLKKIDTSKVASLTWLDCSRNNLKELKLDRLTKLTWLNCSGNKKLTELDIRNCHKLVRVICDQSIIIIQNPDQKIKLKRV